MKDWLDSWRSDSPPDVPGLAVYAHPKLTTIYYAGACPKSIREDSENFLCEFGNVAHVCRTFYRENCALFWWSVPHDLALIGQLPDFVNKLSASVVPVLASKLPQLASVSVVSSSDEDLI